MFLKFSSAIFFRYIGQKYKKSDTTLYIVNSFVSLQTIVRIIN